MKVSEIFSTPAHTVGYNAMVSEAAEIMERFDLGLLPVLEYDDIAGVVTDRNIVTRLIANGKNPAMTAVKDVMNPEVFSFSIDSDIRTAAKLMRGKQVRRLLVLNNDNTVAGILSLSDLASKTNDEHLVYEVLKGISEPTLTETM